VVTLVVQVKRPSREFAARGQVAWRRVATQTQGADFGVDFLPTDDAALRRLLAFARSELAVEATRLEMRVPCELAVRVLHGGRVRHERLADLSHGGAFIRTWNPLPQSERVQLLLRPPMSLLPVQLNGRVAWVRKTGQHAGMGIEFIDTDGSGRALVERLVDRLARE
jgi:uncharacterized protein (TIGR02266 family)